MTSLKLLWPVTCALLLGACCSVPFFSGNYTKFRATDPRGNLVAEWIAEGSFKSVAGGFSIKAVERTSGPPLSQNTHYPNGWQTTVACPNIVYYRCGKPLWLYQIDHEADQAAGK